MENPDNMEENENKIIKAYKGFDKSLCCRGFQYEVGKEYEHYGPVIICNSGFHACKNPFDVLDHYGDMLENRYCEVELSGETASNDKKTASSKINIKAEIGFTGLFKAGIEWLKEITDPRKVDTKENDNGGDSAQICSSGDSAKIGSSGDYAQIGSSGYYAKIDSIGEDSVICCSGHLSRVKAKLGSWITLSEWKHDNNKDRMVPKCVKTEYVDGERIKADTWYKLVDGEFTECDD